MINPQHRERLPEPGAAFVWEEHHHGSGSYPVLRIDAPDAHAVFTTRLGGTSEPPLDQLNVSLSLGDHPARVFCNRDLAARTIDGSWNWSTIRQVHGARVVYATPNSRKDADAVWTDDPARTIAVLVADCVPVLMIGNRGIAAVHAGWRGLVAGVVEAAAREVDATRAWAGPAIGPCCYEVGTDVTEPFAERFGAGPVTDDRHVDLWEAVSTAATSAGLESVAAARLCTSCHSELFFSHRRDQGLTGRQALVARLADG